MSSFPDFSRLQAAVRELGVNLDDCLARLIEGVEVSSEQEYVAAPDGFYDVLPTGDIVRLLIHIGQGGPERCHDQPETWHRFHTARCAAYGPPSRQLKQVKTRRQDGRFTYFLYDTWEQEYDAGHRTRGRALLLCGHCRNKLSNLGLLDEAGTPDLSAILAGDLPRRLHLNPVRFDGDRIFGFPEDDWHCIASHVKNRASWHCTRCSADMRLHRNFLHAHYLPSDGRGGGLGRVMALCAGCHALQKQHEALLGRVRLGPEFAAFRSAFPDHRCFSA